jgi:hypothetical protein
MGGQGFGAIEEHWGGFGGFGGAPPDWAEADFPELKYIRDVIEWNFGVNIEGASESDYRELNGMVMNGGSVRAENASELESIFETEGKFGPRGPGEWSFPEPASTNLECDVAFVALGALSLQPEGKFNVLDAEVGGVDFDGTVVDWQVGIGIDVQPAISSAGEDFTRPAFMWPSIGGLARGVVRAVATLVVQDALFDALEGFATLRPKQPGSLTNMGNVTVMVMSAVLQGSDASEFEVVLEHRGVPVPFGEFQSRLPLELRADEQLGVEGAFRASAAGRLSQAAELRLMTDAFESPELVIRLSAATVGLGPDGAVLPDIMNFGQMGRFTASSKKYKVIKHGLIQSAGPAPLLLTDWTMTDPAQGFHLMQFQMEYSPAESAFQYEGAVLYEVPPGAFLLFAVGFTPVHSGNCESLLIFETNAGRFEVRLFAYVV